MSLSFLSGHTSLSFRTWLLPNDIASPSDQDIPSAFRIPLIKHLSVISFFPIFPSHLHPHSPPHPPKKSKNIDSFSPSTRDTFHNPSRPLMRTRPPLPSKSLSLHSFRIHEGSTSLANPLLGQSVSFSSLLSSASTSRVHSSGRRVETRRREFVSRASIRARSR